MDGENWQQVKEIFNVAVRQRPEERRSYLAKVCDKDENLRREIESLLSSYESAPGFMEAPVVGILGESAETESLRIIGGQKFGHYEIIRQIGRGGMGEVYLAGDTRLDRKVAIKLLPDRFGRQADKLNRFIREAKAASALNHPNILTVYEIGETDRIQYIAAEYIEGETLRELLKRVEPIKLVKILQIAIQTAEALATAHRAGIVHRDIKPENIMIRQDGYVKVLDFGLAKLTRLGISDLGSGIEEDEIKTQNPKSQIPNRNLTSPGMIMGTANYMSPEQVRGKEIDSRSDIFSFGILLYELITRRLPFEGETQSDVLVAILEREPVPFDQHAPATPARLQKIIGRALRKKKKERYRTMEALATDLEHLKRELEYAGNSFRSEDTATEEYFGRQTTGENLPATALYQQPVSTHSATARLIGRIGNYRKTLAAAAALFLLVTIAGAGFWYFVENDSARIRSIAVMPFVNESGDERIEYLSDGMAETLIGNLAQIPGLSVKARSAVFFYKGKGMSPKRLGEELNVEAVLFGRIIQREDDLKVALELVDTRTQNALWSETYDRRMSDLISLQSEIAGDLSESLALKLSGEEKERIMKTDTVDPEAYTAYLKGYHYWNLAPCPGDDCLEKSRDFFRRATELDPNYSQAWSGLAGITAGLPGGGRGYVPDARTAAEKAIELDPQSAEAHMALGIVFQNVDWNLPAAEKELKTGVELDPGYAANRAQYGWLLLNLGKLDEGLKEFRVAHQLDPLALYTNNELSFFLFWAGRYDEAVRHLRQAIELDSEFSSYHNQLATVLAYQDKFAEALAECDQERVILLRNLKKRTRGNQNPQDTVPEKGLCHAEIYALSGRKEEAREILAELGADVRKDAYQNMRLRDPDLEVIWQAEIYALLGDKEKAFGELEKISEIQREVETFYRVYTDAALKFSPSLESLRDDPRFEKIKISSASS